MNLTPIKLTLIVSTCILLSIGLGVIIGYFSAPKKTTSDEQILDYYKKLVQDNDASFLQEIIKETNATSISQYLEFGPFSIFFKLKLKTFILQKKFKKNDLSPSHGRHTR